MAIKTKGTPQKKEALEKEGLENPPDTPLLDLSDAVVKKHHPPRQESGVTSHMTRSIRS